MRQDATQIWRPQLQQQACLLKPLVVADLIQLPDTSPIATGIASIGGAGTFDRIVLSGIVAAYLA
jgi:uncharacterized membrane protein